LFEPFEDRRAAKPFGARLVESLFDERRQELESGGSGPLSQRVEQIISRSSTPFWTDGSEASACK